MVKGGPDLKRYMDKTLAIRLNANRKVQGVLRGFDQFMNIVLDETVDLSPSADNQKVGMVVIRGNSIVQFECMDPV
ncbi:unnamed protein product [Heterosigma akashiwo]|eukprot:CAMPEP_0194575484 /NCGR_PEP_ID=MMETSP0292-20121207/10955_1 /TAXON_ID=39354 /ORGANISM="Heterosigma akashiwo, Strain CCMP2393" /LENGTH=75 /DNA_ID=CAMNT_0039427291 /DNA_START=58 /DNA_END=285 /DNA_ORIENTATION=+